MLPTLVSLTPPAWPLLIYVSKTYVLRCSPLLSRIQLLVTKWAVACQAPLSMAILQARALIITLQKLELMPWLLWCLLTPLRRIQFAWYYSSYISLFLSWCQPRSHSIEWVINSLVPLSPWWYASWRQHPRQPFTQCLQKGDEGSVTEWMRVCVLGLLDCKQQKWIFGYMKWKHKFTERIPSHLQIWQCDEGSGSWVDRN